VIMRAGELLPTIGWSLGAVMHPDRHAEEGEIVRRMQDWVERIRRTKGSARTRDLLPGAGGRGKAALTEGPAGDGGPVPSLRLLGAQPTRVDCALVRALQALVRERSVTVPERHSRQRMGAAFRTMSGSPPEVIGAGGLAFEPKPYQPRTRCSPMSHEARSAGRPQERPPVRLPNWASPTGTIENHTLRREPHAASST
jgi:hypothetical protein